jgi:hypothetical protein
MDRAETLQAAPHPLSTRAFPPLEITQGNRNETLNDIVTTIRTPPQILIPITRQKFPADLLPKLFPNEKIRRLRRFRGEGEVDLFDARRLNLCSCKLQEQNAVVGVAPRDFSRL